MVASTEAYMQAQEHKPPYKLVGEIIKSNKTQEDLQSQHKDAAANKPNWKLDNQGLLTYKERLVVPNSNLRVRLIRAVHDTQLTAHPGARRTCKLLEPHYWWPNLRTDVAQYVAACKPCRWSHVPRDKTPGLLKSLPIPPRAWQDISMDFKAFPKDRKGFDNVFVIVDRLSKRCFSLPCHKTVSAEEAADLYYRHIWRVYGSPKSIVSDRGSQFTSAFWDELCKLIGVKLKLSSAYHPQTDGNTEIVNQWLDQRLRPFVNYHQDNWSDLLPCMDWAQASLPHESTGLTPYEVEFGCAPQHPWD